MHCKSAFTLLLLLLTSWSTASWADISVTDAWLREPIPGQSTSAAYLLLENRSDEARQLVAVETNFSTKAEIHTQQLDDGMMRMRQLLSVDLKAGEKIAFASGGLHIMLFGIDREQLKRDKRLLTLIFQDDERLSVELSMRSLAASHNHTHHH